MTPNETLIRDLLRTIEASTDAADVARFWHPEAEQIEYPSVMSPAGNRRSLAEMLSAFGRGSRLLSSQSYDVRTFIDAGDRAAAEVTWRARTAEDVGGLGAGTTLTAHVALFYEFREGLVLRQSSYDCYEPIAAPWGAAER
jgi:hypothetical protein